MQPNQIQVVSKPQVTIAHLLVWTTAVACLMAYSRLMPLATTVPDNSHGTLLFTLLSSVLGGMGLGGLFWYLPGIFRGELHQRAPGELLLMACGVIVVIDCLVLSCAAARYAPESLDFYRMYISLNCALAVPVFVIAGVAYHGPFVWKLALASPALPYAAWGLATFIDRESGGLGYFWHGNRGLMTYLQFLTPLIAASVFFYALFCDGVRPRRTVGHWAGVLLFVILVGQTLHFSGWTQMFGLLIPEP
jgi:hypothetical protein